METSELKVVTLDGGPRERGQKHGELLRAEIRELLERWDEGLQRVYGLTRERYVERFFAETRFEAALAKYAPNILVEVRAIAEGANVGYGPLLAFQHVNEEFWLALPPSDATPGEACSTIALGASAGQPALIGQNLDLDKYLDGYQVLLRYSCDESDGRILAVSVPGMISLNGMNSHGFAVCDNALTQLRGDVSGVPIFALYRMLLESRSLTQAVDLIHRTPHASGLNWVLGDAHDVAMFESSAGGGVRYGPRDRSMPIYHTNHPLSSGDLAPTFVGNRSKSPPSRPTRSTYLRFAALHERIGMLSGRLTVEAIKSILASRDDPSYPVSRDGSRNEEDEQIGFTLACCIFELTAQAPKLHIASGPPHLCEFRTFKP